ncbi:MAG: NAD(P)/FAD-dependent oxidoreductase [Phycisphaerae bacterium]
MQVTIVGGGVMGMSCAWRLAQRGITVTLLEQGAFGKEASSAAIGALWPSSMPAPGPLQRVHHESLRQYPQFVKELSATTRRSIGYMRRGKVELVTSDRHLTQGRKEVESASHSWSAPDDQPVLELLSPEDARQLEPHVTVGEFGALVCHRSAQIDVPDLLAALESACRQSGVQMRQDAKVLDADLDANRPTVRLADGEIEADRLLVCAGNGTPTLSQTLERVAPVKPIKGQAMLMSTRQPVIGHIVKNEAIFLVPWPDGRVLVGSTTEPDAGFDISNTASGVQFLIHGAISTCPPLADARIESIWAGLRPTGPKRKPLMGPLPERSNVFLCAGHFKVGIGMAPLAADLMTRWMLDETVTDDERQFAPQADSERLL